MTTYATSPTQPSPPIGGPPATPPLAGGPPAQRTPRPRRAAMVGAAGALVTAAVATAATAVALASPITPQQHTVNVVPPPATYSNADMRAAGDSACAAWDRAARSTALASRASAAALEQSWSSPESVAALASEKKTGLAAASYLRTQLSPATPASIADPMQSWMSARLNMLHALNMRDWDEADRVLQQSNDLVDAIKAQCGF